MSDEHAALPLHLPPLEHLSNEELQALRTKIVSVSKDARRKANTAISKVEALKKPWAKMLGLKKDANPEERQEVMQVFERELVKEPEAFIAHAYANALIMLETLCREEAVRKSFVAPTKAKSKVSEKPMVTAPKDPSQFPAATKTLDFSEVLGDFDPE